MTARITILILVITLNSVYGLTSAFDGEIDYDKMVRDYSRRERMSPEDIEAMQQARREHRNMIIRQKMQQQSLESRNKEKREIKRSRRENMVLDEVSLKGNIVLALIVLILGIFMLLYSYIKFRRNKIG